jgi:hypothetical protein
VSVFKTSRRAGGRFSLHGHELGLQSGEHFIGGSLLFGSGVILEHRLRCHVERHRRPLGVNVRLGRACECRTPEIMARQVPTGLPLVIPQQGDDPRVQPLRGKLLDHLVPGSAFGVRPQLDRIALPQKRRPPVRLQFDVNLDWQDRVPLRAALSLVGLENQAPILELCGPQIAYVL